MVIDHCQHWDQLFYWYWLALGIDRGSAGKNIWGSWSCFNDNYTLCSSLILTIQIGIRVLSLWKCCVGCQSRSRLSTMPSLLSESEGVISWHVMMWFLAQMSRNIIKCLHLSSNVTMLNWKTFDDIWWHKPDESFDDIWWFFMAFLSPPVLMHGGLLRVAFCLSVCHYTKIH